MIRPVTCICCVLACASGLYLYQSKHRVQLLDHEIEKTVHATDALREQTRVLHAEWTLMNDPQRLQALADQFLSLKTVTPGQFTSLAELDNRLPAVRAPDPVKPEPQSPPVAQAPDTTLPEEPQRPPVIAAIPQSPPQRTASAAAAPSPRLAEPPPRVAEHKPAPQRPVLADLPPVRPTPNVSRPFVAADIPRPAPPRFMPASLPAQPSPVSMGGSALGMARGAGVPPPQPMPVSASQWVSNGGGG